jgi:hypothetical protein
MNLWRSPSGAITILLWLIFCAAAWSGCGAGDYNIEIVNKYELVGDTPWTCIIDPDGRYIGDFAIGKLGLDGDIIYGETSTMGLRGERDGYFLVNTITGDTETFSLVERHEWRSSLSDLGVASIEMERSSALWGKSGIRTLILAFLIVIFVGMILIALFVIAPSERERRRQELDRL